MACLLIGVVCAAGWFAVFFAFLYLVSPSFIGFGDVRLAPLLGMSLGWLGIGYVLGFLQRTSSVRSSASR